MSRQTMLLSALAAVLLVVVAWLFVYSPQNDEIAELEAQTLASQDQATQLRANISRLEAVRAQAPEIEAQIARLEAVVPSDASLPSALRQLEAAANDSGLDITTLTAARPVEADAAQPVPGLYSVSVSMTLNGSYFQLVDFARRLEDPAITARGLLLDSVGLIAGSDRVEEGLEISAVGRMFSILEDVPVADEVAPAAPADAGTAGELDEDADAEGGDTTDEAAAATTEDGQ